MSTESLECTDVIYHHSYFAFDPEDVERNHGFFRYVILEPTRFEVTNIEGDRVEMVTSNLAAILDPVFWSCMVVVLTLVLLSMTCCCQCCVMCFCSKHKYRTHSDWESGKLCCGGLSWLLTALVIAGSAVIIWSEFNMDSGVQTNWNNTLLFVRGTVPGRSSVTAVHQVMQLFYDLQLYRHWVSIAMNIITIVIMIAAMVAICFCTPYLESTIPVTIFLVVNGIWTFAMSLIAAVTFFSLFYMSFLCYDLYRIGGDTRCGDERLLQNSLSLQKFCSTDVFVPHLITMATLFGILSFLITWQIIGAFYASVFIRHSSDDSHTSQRPRRVEEHRMEPLSTSTNLDYSELIESRQNAARRLSTNQVQPYIPPSTYYSPHPNAYQPEYQPASTNVTDGTEPEPSAPPEYDDCWTVDQSADQSGED